MPILGIEHAAAIRRSADLTLYMAKLDEAKRLAFDLGLAGDVARHDALIRAAHALNQDVNATIDAYERLPGARQTSRVAALMQRTAHERLGEQMMLAPAAGRRLQIGVL